jgi:succinyl-CoA synthetase beta subunit
LSTKYGGLNALLEFEAKDILAEHKIPVPKRGLLRSPNSIYLVADAGISGSLLLRLSGILSTLADIFLKYDCTIIEINPLALDKKGQLIPRGPSLGRKDQRA